MKTRKLASWLLSAGLVLVLPGMANAQDEGTIDVIESDSGEVLQLRSRYQHSEGDDGEQPGDLDRDRVRDRDQLQDPDEAFQEMLQERERIREQTREQIRENQMDLEDVGREMETERETIRNEYEGDGPGVDRQ
jgi:hypothetical protein